MAIGKFSAFKVQCVQYALGFSYVMNRTVRKTCRCKVVDALLEIST